MLSRSNNNNRKHYYFNLTLFVFLAVTFLTPGLFAGEKSSLAEVSFDGLELAKKGAHGFVYLSPGVDFAGYNNLLILECEVAFEKNWQKNFNRNAGNSVSANKASDYDVEQIKASVAEQFLEIFTKELGEKGGYPIVSEPTTTTLILRPAVINLNINAPVLDTSYRTRAWSAGHATLYLELFDAKTGDILARIVDTRVDRDHAYAQWATKAFNKAAGAQIMTTWATLLREGFENANEGKIKSGKHKETKE
ncbi:MAG: hypothetical protein DRH08_03895 [Deltaproteobacteria bacterium]|nr:MAG: hypothetical protein DRH08_03895 [Deltaproteobacteria bacterium]